MANVLALNIVTAKPRHARANMVHDSDCTSNHGRDLQIGPQKLTQQQRTDLLGDSVLFASFAVKF
jgi:hypothetical protein